MTKDNNTPSGRNPNRKLHLWDVYEHYIIYPEDDDNRKSYKYQDVYQVEKNALKRFEVMLIFEYLAAELLKQGALQLSEHGPSQDDKYKSSLLCKCQSLRSLLSLQEIRSAIQAVCILAEHPYDETAWTMLLSLNDYDNHRICFKNRSFDKQKSQPHVRLKLFPVLHVEKYLQIKSTFILSTVELIYILRFWMHLYCRDEYFLSFCYASSWRDHMFYAEFRIGVMMDFIGDGKAPDIAKKAYQEYHTPFDPKDFE